VTLAPGALPVVVAATGLAREARIARGPGVVAVACGVDARRLAAALEREVANGARAIISFGIAGGLVADARAGTWIVGRSVVAATTRWACDAAWTQMLLRRLPGARFAELAGSDAPMCLPIDKRALHDATGAIAVDTESHVAAAVAAAYRLPFAAFRVIADPVNQRLPAAASVALGLRGEVRLAAIAASLARTPGQLPSLMRTAISARTAFAALSRGRRLLGLRFGYGDLRELDVDVA
jgi:hopanoid-associated phosphorylase